MLFIVLNNVTFLLAPSAARRAQCDKRRLYFPT